MIRIVGRILLGLLTLILLLAGLLAIFVLFTFRRSFPKVSGQDSLAQLHAPVNIYRDEWGVPHIYAQNTHDLFFAQGYVHAQDRFWQMDFWRHIGSGRLAEMFGPDQVETDQFLRTLGWSHIAQQELDAMDSELRSILEAYSDGVNAYLAGRSGGALSLEYTILQLINSGYEVEPWQPLHTLTWAKVMAWDLRSNIDDEITRAELLGVLTPQQVNDLFPSYPQGHPLIASGRSAGRGRPSLPGLDLQAQAVRLMTPALDVLASAKGEGIGSNSWVISGRLTDTGEPILANDTHLSAQMPSIWYEIGLHCAPEGPECPYDVTGFSFAGAPSVIIGHNDRIAWGVTNLNADVMDLYIEKINPENPNQYEVEGEWVDMQVVRETIHVAGGEPVELLVRRTRHGPVISDTYPGVAGFSQKAGIDLPEQFALALRWTALEPGYLFRAVLGFNLAQDWEQFRTAAQDFDVPIQNLVYADIDGNIGYQTPGNIPIRANGDGRLPVPGWTSEYDWLGYLPFEELPSVFNPPQGYIVTANNAVVGQDYPHLIGSDWDYGYRARRIVDLIENAPGPIGMAYNQEMQGDNRNLIAEELVPLLMETPLEDADLEGARSLFEGWDYRNDMDSAPAALFAAFWRHLLAGTFQDELPEDLWLTGGSRAMAIVDQVADQPDSPWWDDRETAEVESRDQIFRLAFANAVAELQGRLGPDPSHWTWGDLHTLTFVNQTLGSSGTPAIDNIFNRGPFRTAGGSSIVNATSWNASLSEDPYAVTSLPSMRMIVDFSDLSRSLSIHTTGQSGHAYHPHYIDMADPWRLIQYHPMLWDRDAIEASAEAHLQLVP